MTHRFCPRPLNRKDETFFPKPSILLIENRVVKNALFKDFYMIFPRYIILKTVFPFLCLFFVLNSASFGQAIRPITVSNALAREDDDGSHNAEIGFRINFYGKYYDNVWVNNNGNITFDAPLSAFSPYLIQQNSLPMFAPFFADVDTRYYGDVTRYGKNTLDIGSGNLRNIFCVNWIDVGFYASRNGQPLPIDQTILNSFQLIIIDRSDIRPGDFDLEYNYDKVKWEAGTASRADSCGLGGDSTASMGWSNGTTDFYSHEGSLQAGAFLDAGPKSLIHSRLNSTVDGRYVFTVRNGVVRIKNFLRDTAFTISNLFEPGDFAGTIQAPLVPDPRFRLAVVYKDFILDSLGNLTVSPNEKLDNETQPQYLTVIGHYVNSTDTLYDTAVITVNIIEISNEDLISNQSFTIPENSSPGTAVGTIALNIPPAVAALSVLGTLPPAFNLNLTTRNLIVATGAKLDYEITPVYTFKLIAKTPELKADTALISISLIRNRPPQIRVAPDTTIKETDILRLLISATDPDGDTVRISAGHGLPTGSWVVDSGNGRGTFFWKPGCDISGKFTMRAGATDHHFYDSISIGVDVRVVNFPPVFAPISDQGAVAGEMVRIVVSATDPCIGGTTPTLSVSCRLSGYTFETHGDGTGIFGWKASNNTGSYPIIFYASNGFATAGDTVILSVNKSGSLILTAQPKSSRIYVMPAGNYAGTLLGSDSILYCAPPGTYWFEVEAECFRSMRLPMEIKADSTRVRRRNGRRDGGYT
jgi:hypothetical protein